MLTIPGSDLRALHARAVRLSAAAVARVTPDRLDSRTPCAGWDLRALLEHMITQNHGFAAAARGGADPAIWTVRPSADPIAEYGRSADDVVAAFAAPDIFERTLILPEIRQGGGFPARTALGFHLIDSVVHAWDVARSIQETIVLDQDLGEVALRVALAVPDGPARSMPGAAFAPGAPAPDSASALDRILLVLGRAPGWPDAN